MLTREYQYASQLIFWRQEHGRPNNYHSGVSVVPENAVEPAPVEEEVLVRETRLNPNFYVDENAFMEVANALGFGTSGADTSSTDVDLRDESDDDIPINTSCFIQSSVRGDNDRIASASELGSGRSRRVDRMARSNN